MCLVSIIIFFIYGEGILSYAATKFDPSLKWQAIETQNFHIYFHQNEQEIAQECTEIAEDVYKKLLDSLGWEPKRKISIVIADNNDEANGFATSFPDNAIYIAPFPPSPMILGSRFTNWLRFVIVHEYTHIVHLDMVSGSPGFIRKVFGRVPSVGFPNQLQPLWLIEGLAVYEETNLTEGGRGKEPLFDMILRMAVMEDRINSLDQINTPSLQTFPGGIAPYLYGDSICQYIAEKYGENKLKEIAHNYSRSLPYLFVFGHLLECANINMNVNKTIKEAIGIDANQLFTDWKKELKKRYAKKIPTEATKSKELTHRGYFISNPTWSPDGKYIAYSETNNERYPCLRIMKKDGTSDKKIVECKFASDGFSFSPIKDEIIYSELVCHRNFSVYSRLFIYNKITKKKREFAADIRAKDPSFSPNGEKIIFVANKAGGGNNIATIGITDGVLTYLTNHKDRVQYYSPVFSPDGSRIAFSRWENGFQDIWLADANGQNITPIIQDTAMDINPSWSPDGKYILFSSDRSGIFNLYAFSVKEKELYQITDVAGGAFDPCVSPDGKEIAFVSYSSRGYDIHLMDMNTTNWRKIPFEITSSEIKPPVSQKASNYQPESYNPLPTLFPRFWIPLIAVTQTVYSDGKRSETSLGGLGFATLSWDVLHKHYLHLFSIYDIENKKIQYSLTYKNDQLYPTIGIGLTEKGINWTALTFPIKTIRSEQAVSLIGFQGGFETAWNYTNAQKYGFSISPTDGRSLSFSYKKEEKTWGNSLNNNEFIVDWKEYLGLPFKNQVIGFRLAGAISDEQIFLGGEFGTQDMVIGETSFPIRGYEDDRFSGNKALAGSIEYRFPIKNIERGQRVFPIFFDRLHGSIFVDYGNVWGNTTQEKGIKLGAGSELMLNTHQLYSIPWTSRIGIAYGFNEGGVSRIYFGSGVSF